MATSQEKLELLIGAKDRATPTLDKLKSSIIGIGAAYLGWQTVTGVIGDIIEKAAESEKVWNDVAAALDRHGFAVENNIKAIQSFSSELQRTTGISDELAGQSVQMLIDANNTLAGSFDIVRAAADLSAAKHIDMKTAVDLLIKASEGYTSMLSRYGIIIDESIPKSKKFDAVMSQINERFGGAAQAQLNTYSGQLALFKENLGDLEESIGGAVLPALTQYTKNLNDVIVGWTMYKKIVEESDRSLLDWVKDWILATGLFGEQGRMVSTMNLIADAQKSGALAAAEFTESTKKSKKEVEKLDDEVKNLAGSMEFLILGYPTLTSSADSFLTTMMAQNEETEKTRAILEDLAGKGVNYLVTSLELTSDQIVEVIELAKEMGIEFEGAFNLIAEKSSETEIALAQAWQGSYVNAVAGASENMASRVVGSMRFLQTQSNGIFRNMAADFMRLFIQQILSDVAKILIPNLLSFLGSIFDTAANDRMAAQQGRDFAYYFGSGVLSGIRDQNLGMAIAGEISSTGRTAGSAMTSRGIRKTIIPAIQREGKYGITTIMTSESTMTGGRIGYVS